MSYEPEQISGALTLAPGTTVDVTDRGGRLLGHVTLDNATLAVTQSGVWTVSADVSDRSGRLLGHVTIDNASLAVTQSGVWTVSADVTDRVGRLLGHVTIDNASIAVTQSGAWSVDVSDRAARLLGVVASITAAVDISDRAGRALGAVSPAAASVWDVSDRAARLLGVVASITAAVDISDRAGRSLGQIGVLAGTTFNVGDRAARILGTETKDQNRSQIMLAWEEMAGTAAAESALANFTLGSKAAAALVAANQYTVTAAKTLRIQSVLIYMKLTAAAACLGRFRIRQAAAVANNSPVIFDQVIGIDAGAFAIGTAEEHVCDIPDGLEVAAGQQITFTWFTSVNTCTVGMTIVGFEYS